MTTRTPVQPGFFADLPASAEVAELCRLFEAGQYERLRLREAELRSAGPSEAATVARELLARTRPAPLLLWILALSALLFGALVVYVYVKQ